MSKSEAEASEELAAETITDYENQGESKNFDLLRPIGSGQNQITRVEFKNPNMGHLAVMDKQKGELAKAYALAAAITKNLGISDVTRMHPDDFATMSEVIESFFGDVQGRMK